MKILKLHNCGSKCEHFIINHFLFLHTFECSNPLIKKDGFNRELVGKELSQDFPRWCPLEDYNEDDNSWFPIIMTKKEVKKLLKDTGFKLVNKKRIGIIKNIKPIMDEEK